MYKVYFFLNLLCVAIRPFSTVCALTSTEVEETGTGFCIGCCPASLETLLLLEVTSVWLTLWECRDPLSCSEVLMSEAEVDFGALNDPNPEPKTEDLKKKKKKKNRLHIQICHIKQLLSVYIWMRACMSGYLYQGSVCISGTTRRCMGIAVGCGMCVAVCCRVSIAMGIGKHQTLAKIISWGSINNQAQFRVQRTSYAHSGLGQQASQVNTTSSTREKKLKKTD